MAAKSSAKAKIGVLGASGYTGSELFRLLLRHPNVELALPTAAGRAGPDVHPVLPPRARLEDPRRSRGPGARGLRCLPRCLWHFCRFQR